MAESHGLAVADFEWSTVPADDKRSTVSVVNHEATGAHMKFDYFTMAGTYMLKEWPDLTPYDASDRSLDAPDIWSHVDRWLHRVKAEHDAVDIWALARQVRAWLTSSVAAIRANTQFTALELEQISRHLKTIELYTIEHYKLQEAESAYVRAQLGYLADAATRVGRFDWQTSLLQPS